MLLFPYEVEGRYYKFFIESDGTHNTVTTTDIEGVAVDANYLVLPVGYHVLDIVQDVHTVPGSSQAVTQRIKYNEDGSQAIPLPSPSVLDYATIYALCHVRE